ncbi:hypothetical protein [Thalassolituus maritimus]|uniref:Uncharacterized protein n=1 Tax=Thalassolituus maritimus TaxID=484498 RepID=A0ABQ0A0C0_9GAMM
MTFLYLSTRQRLNVALTLLHAHTFAPVINSLPYSGIMLSGGALWN